MFNSGIIVSCQPRPGSQLLFDVPKLAAEALTGGAVALRIEGTHNIAAVKRTTERPVIGLIKERHAGQTIITPTLNEAKMVVDHGADYVAADATGRWGFDEIQKMIDAGVRVIGDIGTLEQAVHAEEMGCMAVSTTLSGYLNVEPAYFFYPPDTDLVRDCCRKLTVPVIAEGRYWTPKQLQRAKDAGAYAVCIGGAVTDPALITEHWRVCWTGEWKRKAKAEWAPK